MAEAALSGLKVVDLTHYIAGPYCTKLMASLGAEVIKVERPEVGDPARGLGPFWRDLPGLERSGTFLYLNTGKKSVTLDLKTAAGRSRLLELVRDADVLVENFAPRVMPSLGLDYVALEKINPRLVMTSISNFGQTGPYRDYRADELTENAISGLMYTTGEPDREPIKTGGSLAQCIAGITAFNGTMVALLHVANTGEGQHVDVSIMEANTDLMEIVIANFSFGFPPRRRVGNQHQWHPWTIYPCRDGHAVVIGGPPKNWPAMAELVGQPELAKPEFATMRGRVQRREQIDELLRPWLMSHGKMEIFEAGQEAGFAFGYVATMEDLAHSPQLRERGYLIEIEHPETGKLTYLGAPFQMAETPMRFTRAPLLGEHNEEIFSRLSLDSRPTPPPKPERSTAAEDGVLPLTGIRVLDLGQLLAEPRVAKVLADMGAEVIKIESLTRIDGSRGELSPSPGLPGEPVDPRTLSINQTPWFHQTNRNKLSVTLDLTAPWGVAIFKRLVGISDLVLENFRPGTLAKLGLSYPVLRSINPAIIVLSMPGFGSSGPYSSFAAFGATLEGNAGLYGLTGYPGEGPMKSGDNVCDPINANFGVAAVLSALWYRQQTGKGQFIDLSHLESTASLVGDMFMEYSMNGRIPPRTGNRHPTKAPHGCYRCRGEDRWITIAVSSDAEWARLCRLMQRPDLIADPRYADAASRLQHQDQLDRTIESWTIQEDNHELMHRLQESAVTAAAVQGMEEVFVDPHLVARGYFEPLPHPSAGPHMLSGMPFKLSKTPGGIRRAGPLLGQHNTYVLGGLLGLGKDELERMEREGKIGMVPLPTASGGYASGG